MHVYDKRLCTFSHISSAQVSPLNNSVIRGIVPIMEDIRDFAVRKDGAKCLYIDGAQQFCLLQPQLRFALNITGSLKRDRNVTVALSLTSNVYTDTLRWSVPVVLHVARQPQARDRGEEAAAAPPGGSAADAVPDGCIVHSINFARMEEAEEERNAAAVVQ